MLLKLENIKKEYKISKSNKQIILNDINLELSSGEFVCIYGESGSGKSTLMNIIGGLDNNYDGKVKIDDVSIKELDLDNYRRDKIGFVFQNFNLIPYLTVFENVMLMLDMVKLKEKEKIKKTKEALRKVGLIKHSHKKTNELSGGMKRRAGIAQAMLNNPKILILDEPTAGLDPNERIRFRNLISELSEDRLVLLSTHIVSDIEYIANEIWLMKDGEILHKGSIDELINSMTEAVWECLVPKNKVSAFMGKYKISNMKSEINQVMLRIISHEKPVGNAVRVEASLEDVFLYYFGEKAGDKVDAEI